MFELIPEITGRFLAVRRRKWDHSVDTLDPVVMVTCPFCGDPFFPEGPINRGRS